MHDALWDRLSRSGDISKAAEKLTHTTVLLIGCGGLGSEVALKLAGCQVEQIQLIDGDCVLKFLSGGLRVTQILQR